MNKRIIAFFSLLFFIFSTLGVNATSFTQQSIPQGSSNVNNGDILTTSTFNSVVSDIGNLTTDISNLKNYVDYQDTNIQIDSDNIVNGSIKQEDLDPSINFSLWNKVGSDIEYRTGNILFGSLSNPWGLYLWGGNNLNLSGKNGSRLGLQRDVDDAIVDIGNSANNNATFQVYGKGNFLDEVKIVSSDGVKNPSIGFEGDGDGKPWYIGEGHDNGRLFFYKNGIGDIMRLYSDKVWLNKWLEVNNGNIVTKKDKSSITLATDWNGVPNIRLDSKSKDGSYTDEWRIYGNSDSNGMSGRNLNFWAYTSQSGNGGGCGWGGCVGGVLEIHSGFNGTSSPRPYVKVGGDLHINKSAGNPGRLYIDGADLALGLNDGRSKGSNTLQRALVHLDNDTLAINYSGDFEGGVSIGGNKNTGNLQKKAALSLGDSDTGFRQNGDGVLETYANNQIQIKTTSAGTSFWDKTTSYSADGFQISYDSDYAKFRLRHLGPDKNPIEIRTEDANDDGIYLTSNGKDVAFFKRNLIKYNTENSFKGFQNINDVRGHNYGPDWYANHSTHYGFVERSTIGLPNSSESWAYVKTINKWDRTSQQHKLYQIALNGEKMYMRTNTDSTHWGGWKEIGGGGGGNLNSWMEIDRDNHSVGTSWAVIKEWGEHTIKAGRKLEVSTYVPLRNNSTGWGGAYVELQVSINGGSWKRLGNSGYDGVMNNRGEAIAAYTNTFLFNPAYYGVDPNSDYKVKFRTRVRSYDNTVYINKDHDINKDGVDYKTGMGYHHLIIKELYWPGWTATEGDTCNSTNKGKNYYAVRDTAGTHGATYCDGTYWRNYSDGNCTYYDSISTEKKQYVSHRDGKSGEMRNALITDGFKVDGSTESDRYNASGYTKKQIGRGRRNRSSARGTKIVYNGCKNKAP